MLILSCLPIKFKKEALPCPFTSLRLLSRQTVTSFKFCLIRNQDANGQMSFDSLKYLEDTFLVLFLHPYHTFGHIYE